MRFEFSEVLNDLIDYFLLGDIQLLEQFKEDHDLPDDLARAFTRGEAAALVSAYVDYLIQKNG